MDLRDGSSTFCDDLDSAVLVVEDVRELDVSDTLCSEQGSGDFARDRTVRIDDSKVAGAKMTPSSLPV